MHLILPEDLPPSLTERSIRVRERAAALDIDLPQELERSAARALISSEFVLETLERRGAEFLERAVSVEPATRDRVATLFARSCGTETEAMRSLRRIRRIESARIAWRAIAGELAVRAELEELSNLADALVLAAIDYAARATRERFGAKYFGEHEPPPLLVLAMGKLGGHELNFSSDIDLVLLFPDDELDAASVQLYYVRLAQQLIKLLNEPTADGFVYRTDARLRPFGSAGPLVIGLSAFESYLVANGRDWERYAYVKARLLNAPEYEDAVYREILTPYVYRSYLDYGVIDALRQLKRSIRREVLRRDMEGNLKLGSGGIREVEFIVQAHQLVRGGSEPELRGRSLLRILPRLADERLMSSADAADLEAAYLALRMAENRLQALADQQTHSLPAEPEQQARLAYACASTWQDLLASLAAHRETVAAAFNGVVSDEAASDAHAAIVTTWESGSLDELELDLEEPVAEEVITILRRLRDGATFARMDELARSRLAAVLAMTLERLAGDAQAALLLERIIPIYQAVCRRSAYLALISENAMALENLLLLARRSARLCAEVAERPLLLDELLDARIIEDAPSRDEFRALLERQLASIDQRDAEAAFEAIRQFQSAAVFRTAIADTIGNLPLMRVSDRLTDIAELCVRFAYRFAWKETAAKHGVPHCDGEVCGFAVIAYGKLGGYELGYGSDLDLVFVHGAQSDSDLTDGARPLSNAEFFARLAQRIIHVLSIQTPAGRLYEIDTRLRPSGQSGLLVSSMRAFARYQRESAWVWEHQALLRSRAVAGSEQLCEEFEQLRLEILTRATDADHLRSEILSMREKMRAELSISEPGSFDIKQDVGGLADIEFLVDYIVLRNAASQPSLVAYPDKVRQLEALADSGIVEKRTADALTACYLDIRRVVHDAALADRERVVEGSEFIQQREVVKAAWAREFG
ncbi:MAG: bifunctional [glutamate--ammonia ligase]-adenylyl-L-tyrosine phosphorylase/[glutamate--ammonia-ligase] adenylyltransferase [Gammaproteobacteria bacterium]|jgi:glutamate-ammonia-ligase adenylyltransferase